MSNLSAQEYTNLECLRTILKDQHNYLMDNYTAGTTTKYHKHWKVMGKLMEVEEVIDSVLGDSDDN